MPRHECGLDVTHCDVCGDELEAGQTGLCDDCQAGEVWESDPCIAPGCTNTVDDGKNSELCGECRNKEQTT